MTSVESAESTVGGLFDRYAPQLYRYCARRVGTHRAEDIVSEVFLVVARRSITSRLPRGSRLW